MGSCWTEKMMKENDIIDWRTVRRTRLTKVLLHQTRMRHMLKEEENKNQLVKSMLIRSEDRSMREEKFNWRIIFVSCLDLHLISSSSEMIVSLFFSHLISFVFDTFGFLFRSKKTILIEFLLRYVFIIESHRTNRSIWKTSKSSAEQNRFRFD